VGGGNGRGCGGQAPLLWASKSLRHLAEGLRAQGHKIGHNTVATLLRGLGYRLQANRKTLEGASHPDRDAQFHYINQQVGAALTAGEPAISVDTKKKELVGDFKNGGREYHAKGQPEPVRVHDFLVPELGRAAPHGVCDIADNKGWVSVGIDHPGRRVGPSAAKAERPRSPFWPPRCPSTRRACVGRRRPIGFAAPSALDAPSRTTRQSTQDRRPTVDRATQNRAADGGAFTLQAAGLNAHRPAR
jgi:hypothetical protein